MGGSGSPPPGARARHENPGLPGALADLDEIWLYIAADNPEAADSMMRRFRSAFDLLSGHPAIGRTRDELAAGLRSHAVGRYLVVYRVRSQS